MPALGSGNRLAARRTHSLPVLAELRHWLDETLPQVPPTSKLGEALRYLAGQWERLTRYCERGELPIPSAEQDGVYGALTCQVPPG